MFPQGRLQGRTWIISLSSLSGSQVGDGETEAGGSQESVWWNRITEPSSWDLILLGILCRSTDHPGWPRPHLLCLGEPPEHWLPYIWVSHITSAHCGTLSCWMNTACLGRDVGMETGQLSRSPGRLWGPVIGKHLLPAPQLNKQEGGGAVVLIRRLFQLPSLFHLIPRQISLC